MDERKFTDGCMEGVCMLCVRNENFKGWVLWRKPMWVSERDIAGVGGR